uniref:Dehydrogenase/reductase (SDR family) member 13a, tandem duplicate 2 n=1 Tax=Oncorhynchus mykiss TaxID=8022 RepID=A0A8K9UUC3_ONCMY
MLPLLVAAGVVALYILFVETIFKSSKCKANAVMAGKTVIITGVNTGIGKATAMELARRVARVILAWHIQKKAELAISDIKRTGNTDVVYMQLDLGSLQAVHSFTETFLKTEARWDLLINSGLVVDGRTADGFAIEFGVNHLGHFLLTFTLGSMAYCWGNIDFDALVTNKHLGTGSKLCNILFNHELAKRLKGTNVTCYITMPLIVKTELPRNCSLWQKFIIKPIARLLFLDPESGVQTTLHCDLQDGIEPLSRHYFFCCAPEDVQDVVAKGKNCVVAKKLWKMCDLSY